MSASSILTLENAGTTLGWPSPADITNPQGSGAAIYAALVQNKIGRSLHLCSDAQDAKLGVLMADPLSSASEPPLAIVVEFTSEVSPHTLRELLRLAWNFSHAPTLITIEPTQLRVWSCCEVPDHDRAVDSYLVETVSPSELHTNESETPEVRAANALHWVNLVSGRFFTNHRDRFDRNGRADQTLLGNLRSIRVLLHQEGLTDDDICHDLLARVIFVQFLFDRKDQDGNPALTPSRLIRLHKEGILKASHDSFYSILLDYEDSYSLFEWLNTKFNGDLFPAKGDHPTDRAKGWNRERSVVTSKHLNILAEFIRGDLNLASGQLSLWPQYAFDVIPLEFISSIYETFVTERASQDGIFYTPPHLVDFVLDQVLPWDGKTWDLKILDPACGSGIFLVKSFQRLVHRWKQAHPNNVVRADTLRRLLERNIFGVDKDPHAVRVACFSLYLAMCDEIEPRHYWTQVLFPSMRDQRLICSDFFAENIDGFSAITDNSAYDLVVGNAPWGDGVITDKAREWAADEMHSWTVPNNDIGGLFLSKSAHLTRAGGKIALIQSANSLLFNISSTALSFRKQLFSRHHVEKIFNLSALRFSVFKRKTHTIKTSAAPACVMIITPRPPMGDDRIHFVSPKHVRQLVDEFTIVIEPNDVRSLSVDQALEDNQIWPKLMWGHTRDLQLLKRLQTFPSLQSLTESHHIISQQGITYGDRMKHAPHLDGRHIFDAKTFPNSSFLTITDTKLPIASGLLIHSRASTGTEAFECPQLIVKHSWHKRTGRFHARLNVSRSKHGIICNQSYLSVHGNATALEAACLSHNSKLAVYFNFLTSGRFGAYRPKLSRDEILSLPIPYPEIGLLNEIGSYKTLDDRVFELFELSDAERVLIEDAVEYTLGDFLDGGDSIGHQPTSHPDNPREAHLTAYCNYFIRVLKAGFGRDKRISATIFRSTSKPTPYRLLTFSLGKTTDQVSIVEMREKDLLNTLHKLDLQGGRGRIFNRRVARIYEVSDNLPTIYVTKPDEKRFWTRSMGLEDGDAVALDLFSWQSTGENFYGNYTQ
jgi:hypothetical protein